MEKKRSVLLRPVAWIATVTLTYCMGMISKLVCNLGVWAVNEFSHLSIGMVILLVILFGSIYISIYFYSAVLLPQLLVFVSDFIYPSNHAFRYYFVGVLEIIICAIAVFGGIRGWIVQTGSTSMFWFYAAYVHFILAMIVMMLHGRSASEGRHEAAAGGSQ